MKSFRNRFGVRRTQASQSQARKRLFQFGFETLESRQLMAVDGANAWHNPTVAADVDGDGHVSGMDALLLVSELNTSGPRALTPAARAAAFASSSASSTSSSMAMASALPEESNAGGYIDVDGDGHFSSIDLLTVISSLNSLDAAPIIRLTVEATDLAGNTIDTNQIPEGKFFNIKVSVQDVRTGSIDPDLARGVAAAFLDVIYDEGLVFIDPNEPFNRPIYSEQILDGALDSPGLIDEAGGISSSTELPDPGNGTYVLYSITAQAKIDPNRNPALGRTFNLDAAVASATPRSDSIVYISAGGTPMKVNRDNPQTLNDNESQIEYVDSPQIDIVDAIDLPTISITDATTVEGNTGTKSIVFTVAPSDSSQDITVQYATADVTSGAGATANTDYVAASGTLTFAPGDSSKTITITVNNDTTAEPNEFFLVNLSSSRNATLADASAIGTLVDNDTGGANTISINNVDVQVTEGNTGTTTNAVFTVTYFRAVNQSATVAFTVGGGTATSGVDYNANAGVLTFAGGTAGTAVSQTITVQVVGDNSNESDETFQVTLSTPTGATLGTSVGAGTIVNDDGVVSTPSISISDAAAVNEGAAGTSTTAVFTVSLSQASAQTVTVNFATANPGSNVATSGVDYQAASGVLTFAAGVTQATITVNVLGDALDETNENFLINLTNLQNATPGDVSGQGTITDDDPAPTVSISNAAAVAEGASGTTTNAVFTVSLNSASGRTVTVNFVTDDPATGNVATAGADYTTTSGVVTFAAGQTTQLVTVRVLGDAAVEQDESFQVILTSPSNATLGVDSATGTITNDDLPGLSVSDATVTEGNTGTTTNAVFTVSLNSAASQTVTVNFATGNPAGPNIATADTDYNSTNGVVTFLAGETSKTVTVQVRGDAATEPNEIFAVNLTGASGNATILDALGIGTITNDDSPGLSIGNATVTEGNAGTTTSAVFTVSLSSAATSNVTVNFGTANGTATAGSDFNTTTGILTFTPGQTSKLVTVQVRGDATIEPNEDFVVNLTGASSNVSVSDAQGVGTINNDDSPTISISDRSVAEGNAGTTTNAVFSVTLSGPSTQQVTVNYTTAQTTGANNATSNTDFNQTSGVVTFAAGQTTQLVTVQVVGDASVEQNETYNVNLSGASGATIADGTGLGTITNDDSPSLSISNASVQEGNSGSVAAVFTVSLSGAATSNVTVNFATAPGATNPATAGTDYTTTSGPLTFTAGQTTKLITVFVRGDTTQETNETFVVNLSNVSSSATIADGQGLGTIQDDELPGLTISDATVNEAGASAVFTVTLSQVQSQPVTVNFTTANGSGATGALSGSDYTTASGAVTIAAGQTTQLITVAVLEDTLDEANETFTVNLSGASPNAAILDSSGTGTITDNDAAPIVSIANSSVAEGNSGTTPMVFTVSLSAASGQAVTANFATANGTATSTRDYNAATGVVTLAAGATIQTVTVQVRGDNTLESDETFTVNLTSPSNATLGTAQATGTILNDGDTGQFEPASLAGIVYLDTNSTGTLGTKDPGEPGVGGAQITLQDGNGNTLETTTTNSDGSYLFADLEPGDYRIIETQPSIMVGGTPKQYLEGVTTSEDGTVPSNNRIDITLDDGQDSDNNNFSERSSPPSSYSKRRHTNTSGNFQAMALNASTEALWYSIDSGWDGTLNARAMGVDGAGYSQLSLYDADLNPLATSLDEDAELNYEGELGTTYYLALSGDNPEVDLSVTAEDAGWTSGDEAAAEGSSTSAETAQTQSPAAVHDSALSDSDDDTDWLSDEDSFDEVSLAQATSASSTSAPAVDAVLADPVFSKRR